MSHVHTLLPRAILALLVTAGGLAVLSSARADVVDDFKKNQAVAADKLEKEVEQALLVTQKLKAKEPGKALGILNTYKHILETDTFLPKEKRGALLKSVNQQIKTLEAAVAPTAKGTDTGPKKKPTIDDEYAKYGKYTPTQPPSGSPSGTASKLFKDFGSKVEAAKDYEYQKQQNVTKILGNIDVGDIPANGYTSLPKDWKEKTALKIKFKGMYLSEEEKALIKAMNSVLTPNYTKLPFKDVISHLEELTGIPIAVDPNAMKELMIEYDTPVTFKTNAKVTFRTVLKKVLGDVGLAYILKGGTVQVVTPQMAQQSMTVKAYYVADLLPPPMPGTGPFFNEAREQYFANQVMQMIVMTVEPASWAVNGTGGGTIWYSPATKSIVVRNSAEMHLNLKASLSGGY